MARDGISKTQVFEAADQISRAGQQPTVASVRAHLGTGSYTTITAHLREWKNDVSRQSEPDELDVPAEVTAALGRAAQIVWQSATTHFAGELAAIRRDAERARATHASELDDAYAEISRLELALEAETLRTAAAAARVAELDDIIQCGSEKEIELKVELKALRERVTEQSALLERAIPPAKSAKAAPTKPPKKHGADAPERDTKPLELRV